jgi:hypothetical protein
MLHGLLRHGGQDPRCRNRRDPSGSQRGMNEAIARNRTDPVHGFSPRREVPHPRPGSVVHGGIRAILLTSGVASVKTPAKSPRQRERRRWFSGHYGGEARLVVVPDRRRARPAPLDTPRRVDGRPRLLGGRSVRRRRAGRPRAARDRDLVRVESPSRFSSFTDDNRPIIVDERDA